MEPTFFASVEAFCAWLRQHHASERELLVGFYKTGSGRGPTYPEALDAALMFGWIDGVRKSLDDGAYTIRFSPRRPGSRWSAVNIRRVRDLIAQGRMEAAGLRAFEGHDAPQGNADGEALAPGLATILQNNQQALAFFAAQPPGYKALVIRWIMDAKKEDTRLRRLSVLIERSAGGKRIDSLHPSGGDRRS